jgi:hypothetical protein
LPSFWVVTFCSPGQDRDEGGDQGFAASVGIVNEREEAEIERQLLLREAKIVSQPPERRRAVQQERAKPPGPGFSVRLAEARAKLLPKSHASEKLAYFAHHWHPAHPGCEVSGSDLKLLVTTGPSRGAAE